MQLENSHSKCRENCEAALERLNNANENLAASTAEASEIRAALSGADALRESYKAQLVDAENNVSEAEEKLELLRKSAEERCLGLRSGPFCIGGLFPRTILRPSNNEIGR